MSADAVSPARCRVVACGHDLTWSVLDDLGALRSLRAVWHDLLRPGQYFVAPSWVLSWLAWRGDPVRPAVLVAHDARGRLRGLLPLAQTRDDVYTACGSDVGAVGLDVVAPSHDAAEVARGAVEFLGELSWRRIRLSGLLVGGALHDALSRRAPGPTLERVSTYCPHVATRSPWDAYLAGMSKHQRHEIRRKLRRALQVPGTSVRWVHHARRVPAAIDTLFDLHARRFAATRRQTVFRGEALRTFHTQLAEELAESGELILGLLEHEGRAIAGVYGFRCKGGSGLFQSGFDPAAELKGACEALRLVLLRDHAEDEALEELDLLDGCYPWKLRLASGVRRQLDVEIYPRTARGLLAHGLRRLGRGVRSRLLTLIRGPRCPGLCGDPISPAHCRRANCPDADRYHAAAA